MRSHSLAPGLSVVSQGIGVVQLVLLLFRVGANDQTDIYLYLFNMGMLPTQIVVVGVLFPMLLNRERATRTLARLVRRWVPFAGALFVLLASAWMAINGRLAASLAPIVAASLVNAFLQACIWARAVAAEAIGDPNWISGVAIPANALAVVALLIPFPDGASVVAMVSALAVGNLTLLGVMRMRSVGDAAFVDLPESRVVGSRAEVWFLTKAAVSYGGLALIQSMAVVLPPAMLTLLSVAAKIVASLVATFVNAVMPRIVHQDSKSPLPSMRFLAWLYIGGVVVGLGLTGSVLAYDRQLALMAVCVALWILGAVSNAVAQRTAYRFLRPNASRITIFVVPMIAGLAILSSFKPTFDLATLLCAYAAVDATTGAVLLIALRSYRNAVVASSIVVLIAFMWAWSLAAG